MHRTEELRNDNGMYDDGTTNVTGDGTKLSAKEFNSFQEEIATPIENVGIDLKTASNDSYDQLWLAMKQMNTYGFGGVSLFRPLVHNAGLNHSDDTIRDRVSNSSITLFGSQLFGASFNYILEVDFSTRYATVYGQAVIVKHSSSWLIETTETAFGPDVEVKFTFSNPTGSNSSLKFSANSLLDNQRSNLIIKDFVPFSNSYADTT